MQEIHTWGNIQKLSGPMLRITRKISNEKYLSSQYRNTKGKFVFANNLRNALNKDERSAAHYERQLPLKTFGVTLVDLLLDKQKAVSIEIHNEK